MNPCLGGGGRPLKISMTSESLHALEDQLWPHGPSRDVWMIVDSARDPRIYGLLLEYFYSDRKCLYGGSVAAQLETVAPYLIPLTHDDRGTRRLIRSAWGNAWGIFASSQVHPERLRRHLREFLIVKDPQGRRMLFRYYDPRVMRIYLPTCNADELRTVFGPVERFWMEDANSERLLEFRVEREHLIQSRRTLL